MLLEEPQDVVGVFQRQGVDDQPAYPVTLLAAGNAEIYRRDDVICRPVTGLSPSQLAVLWRTGDDRKAIQVFTGIFCLCVQAEDLPCR